MTMGMSIFEAAGYFRLWYVNGRAESSRQQESVTREAGSTQVVNWASMNDGTHDQRRPIPASAEAILARYHCAIAVDRAFFPLFEKCTPAPVPRAAR